MNGKPGVVQDPLNVKRKAGKIEVSQRQDTEAGESNDENERRRGENEKIKAPIAVKKLRPRVPPGHRDGKTAPNAHKLAELGLRRPLLCLCCVILLPQICIHKEPHLMPMLLIGRFLASHGSSKTLGLARPLGIGTPPAREKERQWTSTAR